MAEAEIAPSELVSFIDAIPVACFAFDFDLTLTRVHAYNSRVTAAQVPSRWRDDIPDPEDLARVLRAITETGRSWHVVTFGQPPVSGSSQCRRRERPPPLAIPVADAGLSEECKAQAGETGRE